MNSFQRLMRDHNARHPRSLSGSRRPVLPPACPCCPGNLCACLSLPASTRFPYGTAETRRMTDGADLSSMQRHTRPPWPWETPRCTRTTSV